MEILPAFLTSLLVQSPTILAWLVGIVLAIVFWRKHPRVSLLALIALVIFVVMALINTMVTMGLPYILHARGMGAAQIGLIYTVNGIVQTLAHTVAWGLLIGAVFGWRSRKE